MRHSSSSPCFAWVFSVLPMFLALGSWACAQEIALFTASAANLSGAETGPARTSCDASFSAPCSRVNSEWLARNAAQVLMDQIKTGKAWRTVFQDVTNGHFNMKANFYPFVFERFEGNPRGSTCVAHGADPSLVGMTLGEIFDDMEIGFSLSDQLQQRFEDAADRGGDWVQYMWRDTSSRIQDSNDTSTVVQDPPIHHKVAFVTSVTDFFFIGVGYAIEQLPLDLPCTDKFDSWCSINNVRSLVGKAENRLNEARTLEQFETALFDISFDHDQYLVPGGHYLFLYRYDGPLKAHLHLHRFAGHDLEYIFEQLGRDPQSGIDLHIALREAAEGKGKGWAQYPWKNSAEEPEYTKIAYVVPIEFMGEKYYLGCGYNFIMGNVVPATNPLALEIPPSLRQEDSLLEDDKGAACTGYNLPCAYGSTLQLTSHALSHSISSPLPTDEMFDVITSDPMFKIGSSYVFLWDYNGTCVAHGGIPELVGLNTMQMAPMLGFTQEVAWSLHEGSRATAELGGGYFVYDWAMPDAPGLFQTKLSRIFHLTLQGRSYYGGVDFDHVRAPLQLKLDTGTQANGEIIPCSSQYGSNCSRTNSQAILGQALGDLVIASSETKVRASDSIRANTTVQEVLDSITAGDARYTVNDFHISVFDLDQSLCYSAEDAQSLDRRDGSGCCVAHGSNPEFVGKTWQDILDHQFITSIRGRDLHDRLIAQTGEGGNWMEYSWAQSSGGAKTKVAFSSRFQDGTRGYYVMVEYFGESPPASCDACPSTMECTESGQYFCVPREEETKFVESPGFLILMIAILGVPCLGIIFYYCGKKREAHQNKEQLEQIDKQMQTISKQVEHEKKSASRANKLVASLFPKNVHERILEQLDEDESENQSTSDSDIEAQEANVPTDENEWKIRPPIENERTVGSNKKSRPIADLFPEATISFADIAGFTGWSSTREPSQVFELLETVYCAFDKLASRMKVFKVETIGDCYVSACGVPEARTDHAVVMARFASACLTHFKMLVASKKLEVELGPGTSDLKIRIGLHSGPVTAGVLRGSKGRFQLFGDTVNTAARMESTGIPNRIHLSQETVDLLLEAGKSHLVEMREDKVNAKGKGVLNTFWLKLYSPDLQFRGFASEGSTQTGSTVSSVMLQDERLLPSTCVDKNQGLVDWNVNILKSSLVEVVAHRKASQVKRASPEAIQHLEKEYMNSRTSLKEVKEIVSLPEYNAAATSQIPNEIVLSEMVLGQLKLYIFNLSTMYKNNPFHNWEHATHVTMSVVKMMSRIVTSDKLEKEGRSDTEQNADLHDFTYGITSSPLTQFAVLISALIHDADHPGVPNAQLLKEGSSLTSVYSQSAAELNSLDLAWNMLMEEKYKALREQIYTTESEFLHFRQLMVNVVLATDIMDKDLGTFRKNRWNKTFGNGSTANLVLEEELAGDETNRKATIVLEHLIQASDVAHTMQHWSVYLKWNERFFMECYAAFQEGRSEMDPSKSWYKGEIGFFDFYIIPLSKKLKECGVFGVSSAEYLRYAEQNRKQWEASGQDIVAEFLEKARSRPGR